MCVYVCVCVFVKVITAGSKQQSKKAAGLWVCVTCVCVCVCVCVLRVCVCTNQGHYRWIQAAIREGSRSVGVLSVFVRMHVRALTKRSMCVWYDKVHEKA